MTTILANARIVLRHEIMAGSVVLREGRIAEIATGRAVPQGAEDLGGALLIPGLIDLHTDHVEKHMVPRPGTVWDATSAVMAHDAQVIGAGITTVFDCLALVGHKKGVDRGAILAPLLEGLAEARRIGGLRAEHLVHLRCELTELDIVERLHRYGDDPAVRIVSLMDHSPGDRQFPDPAVWLARHMASSGLSEAEALDLRDRRLAAQATHMVANRARIAAFADARGIVVASHDDGTAAHIAEALEAGCRIAEFPTTRIAAAAARAAGRPGLMGAPNLVRGGSHVGNLSAAECATAGLLDVLASDYVPASLLPAALLLTHAPIGLDLPAAIATVTAGPAAALGLRDRGEIAPGRRADLVELTLTPRPVIRRVWCAGRRVH
jgi:alpha-D-ribose 1-methylphosphonate 5-triphosphate diphosphatase